jgi:uncharacterized glyoxalase superfamily protein PhnB
MPAFEQIVPVLKVVDLDKALAFYTEVLGFAVAWSAPQDGGGDNAMLQGGSVSVLLSTAEQLGSQPQFSGTLYFNMLGVDEFFDRVKDRVKLIWPLDVTEFGQREFGIRDPDGYTLAFAEPIQQQG